MAHSWNKSTSNKAYFSDHSCSGTLLQFTQGCHLWHPWLMTKAISRKERRSFPEDPFCLADAIAPIKWWMKMSSFRSANPCWRKKSGWNHTTWLVRGAGYELWNETPFIQKLVFESASKWKNRGLSWLFGGASVHDLGICDNLWAAGPCLQTGQLNLRRS